MTASSRMMARRRALVPNEHAGGAPKRKRTVRAGENWVEVRISDDAKARLAEWARRTGLSGSMLMRRLLEEALRNGRDERGEIP